MDAGVMTMTEPHRRRLLKAIPVVAGATIPVKALPDVWTRPVVNLVIIPAHAVTTDSSDIAMPQATTTSECIELLQTPVGLIPIPCRNNPAR